MNVSGTATSPVAGRSLGDFHGPVTQLASDGGDRVRMRQHAIGLTIVVAAAIASLLPALLHGPYLGPYDLLSYTWVSHRPGVTIHNAVSSDQIQQMVPWTVVAWREVHSGHLPLWNPYSGIGMPLAFNWQSAVFSLPSILGYLFPLSWAYTAGVICKLIIAGTGAYYAGISMRMRPAAAVLVATVFELSGPFTVWAGYPITGVLCWLGWIVGAAVRIPTGERPLVHTVILAGALAFAIYGGNPESTVFLLIAIVIIVAAIALKQIVNSRSVMNGAATIGREAVAIGTGLALSAPLVLPGAQVALRSMRSSSAGTAALSLHALMTGFLFSRYDGVPIAGSHYFASPANYYVTAAWVGPVVLALALAGLVTYWRRAEVIGIAAACGFLILATWVKPVNALLGHLPFVGSLLWSRSLTVVAFGLAILAGFGLDGVLRSPKGAPPLRWALGGFVVCAVALGVLWLHLRSLHHPPAGFVATREAAFVWPVVGTIAGVAAIAALFRGSGRGRQRLASLLLMGAELGLLVTAAQPLWSSSAVFLRETSAQLRFEHIVASSLVGFGTCPQGLAGFNYVGELVEANDAYGVSEFGIYDSMMPRAYFTSWARATKQRTQADFGGAFCPQVTSAGVARHYGISYIVEPTGHPGPPGTRLVATIAHEGLYSVPHSSRATAFLLRQGGRSAGAPVPAEMVATGPNSWRISTNPSGRALLEMRVADEPGWHASVDGRPLALRSWGTVMLQATIPAGRDVVDLSYDPPTFTIGLALAGVAVAGVLCALLVSGVKRRSERRGAEGRA